MTAESQKRRWKRQAVLSVVLFALLQAACAAVFGSSLAEAETGEYYLDNFSVIAFDAPYEALGEAAEQGHINAMLDRAGLAGVSGLLVLPALVVLKQRFQEIEGGEFYAAAEY